MNAILWMYCMQSNKMSAMSDSLIAIAVRDFFLYKPPTNFYHLIFFSVPKYQTVGMMMIKWIYIITHIKMSR